MWFIIILCSSWCGESCLNVESYASFIFIIIIIILCETSSRRHIVNGCFFSDGKCRYFLTTILEVKVTECLHMLLKQQNWKYETVEHCQVPETSGRIQVGISWSIGNAEYQTILCGWKYPMLASCITKTLCTVLTTQFYVDVGYVTLHNMECMYTHVFSILILTAMIPD
jgi:hypothetical protein